MTASAPAVRFSKIVVACLTCTLLVTLCCATVALATTLEGLGDLDGGNFSSNARGVSSDGSVVVGSGTSDSGFEAFRWTQADGMVGLGDLDGGNFYSSAQDVSSDGSVVVGRGTSDSGFEAFRWTQADGMVGLGDLDGGGFSSFALAVSSDGSVVVGAGRSAAGPEAFRWTQADGMVGLGDLDGGSFSSQATAVSSDGSVVVGYGASDADWEAFRWTQADGMVGLGDLDGGNFSSRATAVSSDGSVVVGRGGSDSGWEAFRWTQADGMVGLGDLEGGTFFSEAVDVSSDGSVVVGIARSDSGSEAFRWTESTGMESFKEMLTSNGVDMTGWTLSIANAISDDGKTIVGSGVSPNGSEAFIVREQGVITTEALSASLATMGQAGTTAESLSQATTSAMMDASHSAILNTASGLSSGDALTGRTQVWVVGTLISDSSFSGEDFGGEGGVGLTHYLANGVNVGGGIFSGKRSLDTSYGGNQKTAMIGPGVFVTYAPEADGFRIEGGGIYHYIDMNLKRGYQNGAGSAQSDGTTIGHALGLYGRIGWAFPVAYRFALQPFVQYNWQRVNIDGYTESGGPFPARFDDRTDTSNRARLGLEAQYAYSEALDFWTWAAWDHRFETKGASMSGQLTGLYAFNYDGDAVDQNWGDAGIGAKWRPYEGFETFSRLGVGIDSQDNAEPDLALTIGLSWDI